MLHNTLFPLFLRVYNVDLELWEETRLGTPVSSLSLEAMNLILLKDGIPAYIGTREGFGEYLQNLNSRPGESSSRFLTFCQGHTIRALLGLCRYTDELGRSLVIFYGSPLTWALTVILACRQIEWFTCLQPFKEEEYAEVDGKPVYRYVLPHEAVVHEFNLMNDGELNISDIELHEASTYFI